jgi:hypothetical protein
VNARGGGIDVRWAVIEGDEEFFKITKRLHHNLHGDPGDGGALGAPERTAYEHTLADNAQKLVELIRSRDVVLLHDCSPSQQASPTTKPSVTQAATSPPTATDTESTI